jgi:hypothetical protein
MNAPAAETIGSFQIFLRGSPFSSKISIFHFGFKWMFQVFSKFVEKTTGILSKFSFLINSHSSVTFQTSVSLNSQPIFISQGTSIKISTHNLCTIEICHPVASGEKKIAQ